MASSISSLGIGSGVLTSDVIDQLKAADESRVIKPIENKITLNNQQQDAYTLLSSLMTTFKASASALSYSTIFDNKTVDVDGKAEVTVDPGATVESFTLETVELAKKDITKLGAFGDKNATPIATGAGVLKINNFEIAYDATTTLQDLAQVITDTAGDSISASILQTGDGAYSLVISSSVTGADQALTITDTDDGTSGLGSLNSILLDPYDAATNPTGYEKIQTATNATFKYNGITTTRSTNEISDLILGVELKLKEEGDISRVDIEQDTDAITAEMQLFVDSYNALITNLSDMTLADKETGAEGIFNGDSFIKSISRDVTKTITAFTNSNDSLVNYGISLDRSGTMSFDQSTLEAKLNDDPDAVKLFFVGGLDSDGNDKTGIFETINEKLNSYTGYGKLLSSFEENLKSDGENLAENHFNAQASLDARYDIMVKRFIAYDAIISKINSQFSSLQMMIDAEANAN